MDQNRSSRIEYARLVIVSSEAHLTANKLRGVANWPSIHGKLNDEEYCAASVMRNRYEHCWKSCLFANLLLGCRTRRGPVSVTAINFCHSRLTRSCIPQWNQARVTGTGDTCPLARSLRRGE
ncbi:hypothetical protein EV363DRAFT_895286 [Boletus edulis]|uniref:Uncharacterized protein n=1 Tax=Boletus edulis BED1 TaxID=1328754 RepID=A0AAD4C116_BOLED|nr:hypothetical protein EV363DRAFT_895286 [Boletus edulis]KAF8444806.1 hypothetical protein L210DRAFT_3047287 [Boletus edulis BED1]